jgi:ATP-dependent Clp protease ATP-binding subunit ClpB
MNIEKFTINSSKRIQEAQDMANRNKSAQIFPLHLLASMLSSSDSLVKEILLELGVDLQVISANIKKELGKVPSVSGNYQLSLSNDLNTVFIEAEKIAERNKDSYITEEHLLLALIDFADTSTKSTFSSL